MVLGAITGPAVAGCLDSGSDAEETDTADAETDSAESGEEENDSTDESDGSTDDENDTTDDSTHAETPAEQAVYGYLQALDDGDLDAARDRLHPESNLLDFIDEDEFEPGVDIFEIAEVPFAEVVSERFDVEDDDEVDRMENNLRDFVEETGGDAFEHVYMSISSEEYGDEESYLIVISDDETWLVFGEVDMARYEGVP